MKTSSPPSSSFSGQKVVLQVDNMTCAACSSAVERRAKKLNGVEDIQVNLVAGKATLWYNAATISLEEIMQTITHLGYPTKLTEDHLANAERSFQREFRQMLVAMIFASLLFMLAMLSMVIHLPLYGNLEVWAQAAIQIMLTTPVILSSLNIYRKGLLGLIRRSANMDTLITISTISAMIYSIWLLFINMPNHSHGAQIHFYFETVAVILALVKLGKYLEARSKKRANLALVKLFELESDEALLINDQEEVASVPASQVKVGQQVLVRPGMRVPFDGVLISGSLALDESHLTGESMPVNKSPQDKVQAGSLNQAGSATIKVERIGEDTTLAQLRRIVEQAQLSKAPIARLADQISAIFVPVVFSIALFSAIAWFLGTQDFTFALTIFMAVLVIACPCALGLATPTAIVVGVNRGASMGVLIKNSEVLEKLGSTQTIVFDKTGTLTSGHIVVNSWKILNHHINEQLFLQLSASAEQRSEHPIAKAIVQAAINQNITLLPVENFEAIIGFGIQANINDHHIAIGLGIINHLKLSTPELEADLEAQAAAGFLPIPLAIDGQLAGYFLLSDSIKDSSSALIASLKKEQIEPILLSGDQQATTARIAKLLQIHRYYAQASPQSKEEIIKQLTKHTQTMMVGDGINDAAALSRAHTSVTVHNASDVTIEVADVVLMQNDMQLVLKVIQLSRKTLKVIKQNLFWAFIYNIIGIPIAAGLLYIFGGPLLNPMMAALFMAFSSIFVLINSLRLKTIKL